MADPAPIGNILGPEAFFGTKYSGFQNIYLSWTPTDSNMKVERVVDTGPSSSRIGSLQRALNINIGFKYNPLWLNRVRFQDLLLFAKDQKAILYDADTHQPWTIPELSLALQIAHIWAIRQEERKERNILLNKLPYARPSADNGHSALLAITEARDVVLRDNSDKQFLFGDLMGQILGTLDTLRNHELTTTYRWMAPNEPLMLNGLDLVEIAWCKPEISIWTKEIGKVDWWSRDHPHRPVLFGRNLEPKISTIPVGIESGDTKIDEDMIPTATLDHSSNQPSGFVTELQQATTSDAQQKPKDPPNDISKGPDLVKGSLDDAGVASPNASSIASGRVSPTFSNVTAAKSWTTPSAEKGSSIYQLKKLLLDDEDFLGDLTTCADQETTRCLRSRLGRLLREIGEHLFREASTTKQIHAAEVIERTADKVAEIILNRLDPYLEVNVETAKDMTRDRAGLYGLYLSEMKDEDVDEQYKELIAHKHAEVFTGSENVRGHIRHYPARETLHQRMKELATPRISGEGAEEHKAIPQSESMAPTDADTAVKEFERLSEGQPNSSLLSSSISKSDVGGGSALSQPRQRLQPSPQNSSLIPRTRDSEARSELLDRKAVTVLDADVEEKIGASQTQATMHESEDVATSSPDLIGPEQIRDPATNDPNDQLILPDPGWIGAPNSEEKEDVQPMMPQPVLRVSESQSRPLPPLPEDFIQRLDDGRWLVKTRNRCNDIFEDIVAVNTREEAETFFRDVDRYDRLRGPLRKIADRFFGLVLDFRTTNSASSQTKERAVRRPEGSAYDLPAAGRDAAVAREDVSNAGASPGTHNKPSRTPTNSQQSDTHDVLICLPLGRPTECRLSHAKFAGQGGEPSAVTDEAIFRKIRYEAVRYIVSRGLLRRFLLPLRISKVEYYEFTLYVPFNTVSLDDNELAVKGKFPSDHKDPPEWRERCPVSEWFVHVPTEGNGRDLRASLASANLTHAVRRPSTFSSSSATYQQCIPWKLRKELGDGVKDRSALGWGFAIIFEFDFVVFWCIWIKVCILLSLILVLGLAVPKDGPAHGRPGVAVGIVLAPFGLLATVFGGAYAYAKQRKYLD